LVDIFELHVLVQRLTIIMLDIEVTDNSVILIQQS
jgi:hypothetical protein